MRNDIQDDSSVQVSVSNACFILTLLTNKDYANNFHKFHSCSSEESNDKTYLPFFFSKYVLSKKASIKIPNHTEGVMEFCFLHSNMFPLKYANISIISWDFLNRKVRKCWYGHNELILQFLSSSFKCFYFVFFFSHQNISKTFWSSYTFTEVLQSCN